MSTILSQVARQGLLLGKAIYLSDGWISTSLLAWEVAKEANPCVLMVWVPLLNLC